MRIALVGVSHLAAWAAALKEGLAGTDGHEAVFWGTPRGQFHGTALRDGHLVARFPETALRVSGGRHAELPVAEFDLLLCDAIALPLGDWLRETARQGLSFDTWSDALLLAAIAAAMEKEPVYRVAREIAPLRPGRVFATLAPLRARGPEDPPEGGMARPDPGALDRLEALIAAHLAACGLRYLPLMPDTLDPLVFSRGRYREGAVRLRDLDEIGPEDDLLHMNALYGAERWRQFLAALAPG